MKHLFSIITALLALFTPNFLPSRKARQCGACLSPFEALRVATENLSDTIYRKASWFSIWLSYIKRGTFPKNSGVEMTTFQIGNSEPIANAEGWTDITLSQNALSSACDPTFTSVDVGYDEATYGPRKFGLKGPVICKDKLDFAHNPTQFITQYQREMTKRAKRTWEFEFRNQFVKLGKKAVTDASMTTTEGVTTLPTTEPTSQLTWDYLDTLAINLIQDGATDADQDMIELGPDGPVFPLLIGLQAKQRLFTNISAKRTDVNYAQMGKDDMNLLFRRIGATDVHKNFRMIPEVLPPRADFVDGILVERDTFEMVSASGEGTKAQLTSAWKNAEFEAAIQLHPDVFHAEMIQPDNAGLNWNPSNYMGEWQWVTGGTEISDGSACFDPLKKLGRHFAEFRYAPKPIFPNFGTTIWFKRCPNDISTTSGCTYS